MTFAMVWLLVGIVAIGMLLPLLPAESEPKVQPDGRESHFPLALRADRVAIVLLVLAVDLIGAASFLSWPMDVFGSRSSYVTVLFLGALLPVGPVAWFLIARLDSASKRRGEDDR